MEFGSLTARKECGEFTYEGIVESNVANINDKL
jgi:hypothetical protein